MDCGFGLDRPKVALGWHPPPSDDLGRPADPATWQFTIPNLSIAILYSFDNNYITTKHRKSGVSGL